MLTLASSTRPPNKIAPANLVTLLPRFDPAGGGRFIFDQKAGYLRWLDTCSGESPMAQSASADLTVDPTAARTSSAPPAPPAL